MKEQYIHSLEEAIKDEPIGEYCALCKNKNDWWDDIGWFYAKLTLGYLPICKNCWNDLGLSTAKR